MWAATFLTEWVVWCMRHTENTSIKRGNALLRKEILVVQNNSVEVKIRKAKGDSN